MRDIDGAVMKEIEEAARFADDSPFPEISALFEHVYGDQTNSLNIVNTGR